MTGATLAPGIPETFSAFAGGAARTWYQRGADTLIKGALVSSPTIVDDAIQNYKDGDSPLKSASKIGISVLQYGLGSNLSLSQLKGIPTDFVKLGLLGFTRKHSVQIGIAGAGGGLLYYVLKAANRNSEISYFTKEMRLDFADPPGD